MKRSTFNKQRATINGQQTGFQANWKTEQLNNWEISDDNIRSHIRA